MAGLIYLDNSATTRVCETAIAASTAVMRQQYFNPSSAYAQALSVERDMDACREQLTRVTGLPDTGWIFTSGGTEANNLAILGTATALRDKRIFLATAGEHPSVLEAMKAVQEIGHEVKHAPLNREGNVDMDALKTLLTPNVALVSAMQVNNETGAVNDISAISALMKNICPDAYLHVDGVQGFLRDKQVLSACDFYAISGHKIHAPKGIGALYISPRAKFKQRQLGGGQERGFRAGTENTPGIAALCAAIVAMDASILRERKTLLFETILADIPNACVNGPNPKRGAPHILSLSFPPVGGEVMLHALEEKGVLVSTGSACSAKKDAVSHVLVAMSIPKEQARCAVRFSFSPYTTADEIIHAARYVIESYDTLRAFRRH